MSAQIPAFPESRLCEDGCEHDWTRFGTCRQLKVEKAGQSSEKYQSYTCQGAQLTHLSGGPHCQRYSKLLVVYFIVQSISMTQNREKWGKESDYFQSKDVLELYLLKETKGPVMNFIKEH